MISRAHASLIVAQAGSQLMGYCLVLFHRGTSLARLYSIAIATHSRGMGLGKQLLDQAEQCALAHDCAYMRLEVRSDNPVAITLYERNGYRRFAEVNDYYEDHAQALRLEKRILQHRESRMVPVPYYQQTTDFTCGPACLLMAMCALQPNRLAERTEELQIWREATTVFMTSGHGVAAPAGWRWQHGAEGFACSCRSALTVRCFSTAYATNIKRKSYVWYTKRSALNYSTAMYNKSVATSWIWHVFCATEANPWS